MAAALTVVILLGYGGYAAWRAISGPDSEKSTQTTDTGYGASVSRAIFLGGAVVGAGIDVRLVNDLGPFREGTDEAIFRVGAERANLERLAASATGERADILASSVQALDDLAAGMARWRDTLVNLRLGSVDDAESAIDSASARLRADLERWNALDG